MKYFGLNSDMESYTYVRLEHLIIIDTGSKE